MNSEREEYLEYLNYAQLSDIPEPTETYTDWAGLEVLSYKDWLAEKQKQRAISLSEE